MATATLLFYATASFFLGLIASTAGGATVLESFSSPGSSVIGGSLEPGKSILNLLTVGVPVAFLAMAVASLFVHPAEGPATASELRELIAELDPNAKSAA